jgi:hypothetical protein
MTEYVKFLNGGTSATMANREFRNFVELARSDESPGEGWWPVEKVLPKPTPYEGEELAYSYTVRDGVAYKEYMLIPVGKSFMPRAFSKLKIVAALMNAGVWTQVKTLIEQAGLYDLFLAAQIFTEDNEYFASGKAQLQTALGWTDEQAEAILEASVAS